MPSHETAVPTPAAPIDPTLKEATQRERRPPQKSKARAPTAKLDSRCHSVTETEAPHAGATGASCQEAQPDRATVSEAPVEGLDGQPEVMTCVRGP